MTEARLTEVRVSEVVRTELILGISSNILRRKVSRADLFGAHQMGLYVNLHLLVVGYRLVAYKRISSNRLQLLFYRQPNGDASRIAGAPSGEPVTKQGSARDCISRVVALSLKGLGRRPRREARSIGKPTRVRPRRRVSL